MYIRPLSENEASRALFALYTERRARTDKFSPPIFRDCVYAPPLARRRNSGHKSLLGIFSRSALGEDETSLRQLGTFDRVVSRPGCMPECLILSRGPGTFFASEEPLRITAERERRVGGRIGGEDEEVKEKERERVRNVSLPPERTGRPEMRDMRARSLAWEWTGRGSKNGNECRDGLYKWASYSIRDALGSRADKRIT